jgi:maltose alpha-D-glucosyltransferase/alpha-amylase
LAQDLFGRYLDAVRLLGRRTAELHLALAAEPDHPIFAPEPFTQLYQRSLYQTLRNLHRRGLEALAAQRHVLLPAEFALAELVLGRGDDLLGQFQALLGKRLGGQRIRCHGDYNLWEVLFTGKDFAIIDFEGDPRRTLGDRRIKRSPLRDVAIMIRSFDYAVTSPLLTGGGGFRGRTPGIIRPEDISRLRPWAAFWLRCVVRGFLDSYLESSRSASFLPADHAQVNQLLHILMLERTLQELTYELTHRPAWAPIPLRELARRLGLA